ncbi:MAG: thiamine pyrophosphate-binding protein [Gammaproteobacteria bacterium]|nr:thiamine pyrophosphate-binding protein [Gammaproteobacteria bacterium]
MHEMSGADALLAQILANGTDTIYGLPGGQLDHFFDSMHRAGNRIRFIGSRHEQGAAYMALGHARSTGNPGVYCVVPGPGVLNTAAALCTAYATNAPVLCLTGQIPSEGLGRGIGYLHELPDQLATLSTLTRASERIMTPEAAPDAVNEAFRRMLGGRQGPVSLEMPMDIMARKGRVKLLPPASVPPAGDVDPEAAAAAARMMAKSRAPMIVAGGGAIGAREELNELAERLQAPVVTFRNGRGIVSDRSYLSQNLVAGYELWRTADLVIGIGSRMEQQYLHWGIREGRGVIRIDIDPEEFARHAAPDVALNCDAGVAIAAILGALDAIAGTRPSREGELAALKDSVRKRIEKVQPQVAYLDAIRDALPDDGFLVDEITQVGYASWYAFPVYEPRHLVTSGYQGTLGYGYATALGVKAANPDKPVVNLAGDGGFLYTSNEMATAAQYNIGLVTVLFNNNKFQNVQRQQRDWFGGRIIGSDLKNPDFIAYGESFGISSSRVDTPEALRNELARYLARDEPGLIEVPVGDMASPWEFIIREPLFA